MRENAGIFASWLGRGRKTWAFWDEFQLWEKGPCVEDKKIQQKQPALRGCVWQKDGFGILCYDIRDPKR